MRLRILFILHLPPPVHGASLMGSFVKASEKVNQNFEGRYINLTASRSIDSIGKGGWRKSLFILNLLFNTFKSVATKRFDVCYVTITSNGTAFYKDMLVVAILKLFRKKILLHFHNKGVEKGTREKKFNKHLYQFVLGGKRTRVILLSQNLYADIQRYVEPGRVYYCANGIRQQALALPMRTGTEPARILFLSNMMVAKGVYVLLEACAALRTRNIPFECHFVGDWLDIAEKDFHQKVKELGLESSVIAHGKKYDAEKNEYYSKADIFVFPTLNEAFGLVLLEAMQFGVPVIASDEGGIPDIVVNGETGYIVPKNEPMVLAQKLVTLISDPALRQKMGCAGKQRFEQHFTIDRFEDRLVHIINDFAGAA
jgi:glycosyltransferase involved in cell wall biosynthesis